MRFAVIACSQCGEPRAVETRFDATTCPRCGTKVDLADRKRLWEGDDISEAQLHAGRLRAAHQGLDAPTAALVSERRPKEARHDSPLEAAAAKGSAITNKSHRAEAVALWMQRLVGPVPHGTLLQALEMSGIERARAESEVVRMLACDVIYEPRAGHYAIVEG